MSSSSRRSIIVLDDDDDSEDDSSSKNIATTGGSSGSKSSLKGSSFNPQDFDVTKESTLYTKSPAKSPAPALSSPHPPAPSQYGSSSANHDISDCSDLDDILHGESSHSKRSCHSPLNRDGNSPETDLDESCCVLPVAKAKGASDNKGKVSHAASDQSYFRGSYEDPSPSATAAFQVPAKRPRIEPQQKDSSCDELLKIRSAAVLTAPLMANGALPVSAGRCYVRKAPSPNGSGDCDSTNTKGSHKHKKGHGHSSDKKGSHGKKAEKRSGEDNDVDDDEGEDIYTQKPTIADESAEYLCDICGKDLTNESTKARMNHLSSHKKDSDIMGAIVAQRVVKNTAGDKTVARSNSIISRYFNHSVTDEPATTKKHKKSKKSVYTKKKQLEDIVPKSLEEEELMVAQAMSESSLDSSNPPKYDLAGFPISQHGGNAAASRGSENFAVKARRIFGERTNSLIPAPAEAGGGDSLSAKAATSAPVFSESALLRKFNAIGKPSLWNEASFRKDADSEGGADESTLAPSGLDDMDGIGRYYGGDNDISVPAEPLSVYSLDTQQELHNQESNKEEEEGGGGGGKDKTEVAKCDNSNNSNVNGSSPKNDENDNNNGLEVSDCNKSNDNSNLEHAQNKEAQQSPSTPPLKSGTLPLQNGRESPEVISLPSRSPSASQESSQQKQSSQAKVPIQANDGNVLAGPEPTTPVSSVSGTTTSQPHVLVEFLQRLQEEKKRVIEEIRKEADIAIARISDALGSALATLENAKEQQAEGAAGPDDAEWGCGSAYIGLQGTTVVDLVGDDNDDDEDDVDVGDDNDNYNYDVDTGSLGEAISGGVGDDDSDILLDDISGSSTTFDEYLTKVDFLPQKPSKQQKQSDPLPPRKASSSNGSSSRGKSFDNINSVAGYDYGMDDDGVSDNRKEKDDKAGDSDDNEESDEPDNGNELGKDALEFMTKDRLAGYLKSYGMKPGKRREMIETLRSVRKRQREKGIQEVFSKTIAQELARCIKADEMVYTKILLYEKVSVKAVKERLKSYWGVKVSEKILKSYLEAETVVLSK